MAINDEYGHSAGDDLLKELGEIFSEAVNIFGGQAFCYGGEEFAFLMLESEETSRRPSFRPFCKA
ncbi:diguanylate cyclase domain-containing protein [Cytobacillus sp. BC1816]|uniref:diguanylate cyclase domain-containing protein n=1 Tax=Cytobacillus sp. BC1816 TaxID=3440154 RepID=UPI003F51015D